MCLHFGLVATNAVDKNQSCKALLLYVCGMGPEIFPQSSLFKLYTCTVGCLKQGGLIIPIMM